MKRSEWDRFLKGFYIVDCAVRSNRVAYVLAVQNDTEEEGNVVWHLISWAPDVIGDGRSIARSEFFNLRPVPRIAVEFTPDERYILCDTGTYGWVGRQGKSNQPGLMHQMRTLWDEVYVLNSFSLSRRNGTTNEWEALALHPAILEDYNDEIPQRRYVLKDFDAFSPDTFYLMDTDGYIFYQSDDQWQSIDLKEMGYPELLTDGICCGPDGWVYVFARDVDGAKIFQGREDQWKVIWTKHSEMFHVDFVAYQDYVILSNNLGRFKIKEGVVERFQAPVYGSLLSVRDNLLMVAGSDEAAIYDGEEWQVIISPRFNEEGEYQPLNVKLNRSGSALLEQLEYASSEQGKEELAQAKTEIDQLDENALAELQQRIHSAVKRAGKTKD